MGVRARAGDDGRGNSKAGGRARLARLALPGWTRPSSLPQGSASLAAARLCSARRFGRRGTARPHSFGKQRLFRGARTAPLFPPFCGRPGGERESGGAC